MSNKPAKIKRVTIVSPPQSPEETPRRLSSGRVSPPPPPAEQHEDDGDSDSTATADSELEQATLNTRRNSGSLQPPSGPGASVSGAPYNPFARTLATSEAAFGLQHVKDSREEADRANGEDKQRTNAVGRPAMDVDMFKNILLTGSAAPSPPVSGTPQRVQDSSSSTDASSMSRSSLFDPYLEIHPETPRTSFDQMDYSSTSDDDEEGSSLMSGTERLDDFAPPAPPKHSHGKPLAQRRPQTVSFADFDDSIPRTSTGTAPPGSNSTGQTLKPRAIHRSRSDLNKPLPPPPQDTVKSKGSKLDVPLQTTSSTDSDSQSKKVPPPPPPASRRAGQTPTTQGLGRSPSNAKATSEEASALAKPTESTPKSGPAPPPPPSRKSRPMSESTTPFSELPSEIPSSIPSTTDSKSAPMPPPPPRRNPSKTGAGAGTSVNRTPSTASRSSFSRKENQLPSTQNAPTPPPPRRGIAKRESMDGPPGSLAGVLNSRRSSENEQRRDSQASVEGGKWNSSTTNPQPMAETVEPLQAERSTSATSMDILADMNALQAEIDALRAKAERG